MIFLQKTALISYLFIIFLFYFGLILAVGSIFLVFGLIKKLFCMEVAIFLVLMTNRRAAESVI